MKDLKAFIRDVDKAEALVAKVRGAKSVDEIVKIGSEEGYKFTSDEYMDEALAAVSGGGAAGNKIRKGLGEANDVVSAMGEGIGVLGGTVLNLGMQGLQFYQMFQQMRKGKN